MVAQGGSASGFTGGYGGYSVGYTKLKKDDLIYVIVVGAGSCKTGGSASLGGYNGGGVAKSMGNEYTQCSGGGATHISTIDSELRYRESDYSSTVYLVAGGGGGSGRFQNAGSNGGHGGGAVGTVPSNNCTNCGTRTAGSQTSGGTGRAGTGSFGLGAGNTSYSCGGGGGLYGGGADTHEWGAQGGSGYINSSINGVSLLDKAMYCYGCSENTNVIYKTISTTGSTAGVDKAICPTGASSSPVSKCAKAGSGHARITLISLD